VSRKQRPPFVALASLVRRQFADIADPAQLILSGQVLVNGSEVSNPRALVRSDAAIKLRRFKSLRGARKLAHALETFGLHVDGFVALDVGAAAGGFTQALLEAGAARVYAVDVGFGQLQGWLRADPRVINLERTNLGFIRRTLVPEDLDIVTMDLSYLAVADALPQLDHLSIRSRAHLIALVKPTFELRAGTLAALPEQVGEALTRAMGVLEVHGWCFAGSVDSPISGARGAIEVLLHATRR
jgi:23S rRNA (cytidine1920-2'-O)/16S rRNA (cytidine1409-2'-O)-methyltransferase